MLSTVPVFHSISSGVVHIAKTSCSSSRGISTCCAFLINTNKAATATQAQPFLLLQATGLAEHRESGAPATAVGIRMHLPDLSRLSSLTALNLSDNRLTRMPPMLAKLKQMRMLDMSCNQELQVRACRKALAFACF